MAGRPTHRSVRLAAATHALPAGTPFAPVSVLLLALLLVFGLACGEPGSRGPEERWNVLLVTFDTTRADHFGCYGNPRVDTPTVDRLAREGVRFARTLSSAPITAPSHSTLLTGRYPIAHGVRDNGLFTLAEEQLTLAEILRSHGYATAAAVGAYPLISTFGFAQGFDLFDDHLTGIHEDHRGQRILPKEQLFFDERRAAQVNEAILPWLEERARDPEDRPFFAWVHYFDPHQPLTPPPPWDSLYADDLYAGEIAYTDSRLGFLLEYLEELGELDRTLVVMTADHGEGLGEHNEITHAILAYNSTLHVPLVIRPPGDFAGRGTVVESWVGTADVLPTILDLLDLELPETVQGHSLVPYWTPGGRPSRWTSIHYAENLSPRLTHGWGELRVLLDGSMKYIHGPTPELFDLDADPRELRDLSAARPEETERMRGNLEAFLQRRSVAGISATEAVDEEVRRRLESLGYLQRSGSTGGETIVERLRSDGVPPQERVGDVNDLSTAKHLLFQGKGVEALPHTRKLVARDPDNPLYLELHATANLVSGHLEEAWPAARRLAREGSLSARLMLALSAAEFENGDPGEAVQALRTYLDTHSSAQGEWLLAGFHRRLERPERARAALEKALEVDPAFAPARIDLAVALARGGDPAAEAQFRRALEDGPYYAKGFYNFGTFLLHAARFDEAAASFRRALALAPDYREARVALVAAYVSNGQRTEAEEAVRTLEALASGSPEAARAREILTWP